MPGRAGRLLCRLPLEMDLPAAEIHSPCRAGILQGWYLTAGCSLNGRGSSGPPCQLFGLALQSLHENIIRDIRSKEYDKPTPIQAQGIPVGMSGRCASGPLSSS